MELDLEKIKAEGSPVAVTLVGGEKSNNGEVYLKQFSDGVRLARALRTGALFFLATVAMAFIPIAHFILVPLGLVLTVVFAVGAMGTKSIILGGSGLCPYCGKVFRIFKHADRFPFSDVCEGCHRQVRVERTS